MGKKSHFYSMMELCRGLDNVILVLLGAILSRAVVGASPFIPTLIASLVLTILHRLFAIWGIKSHFFGSMAKGEKILLCRNGKLIEKNLKRALISKEDLLGEIRLKTGSESLDELKKVYMERNGKISVVVDDYS